MVNDRVCIVVRFASCGSTSGPLRYTVGRVANVPALVSVAELVDRPVVDRVSGTVSGTVMPPVAPVGGDRVTIVSVSS